ncbi:MAG TPA: tyrosine-type recombinase/integrase [Bryobacteraceae bacterium]|nr:tyrosine-type recombinase/integrase [Bryobacteraceae bacterium]
MTRSSSAAADSVGHFLRNQSFRHPETGRIYCHILRAFQSFVIECSTDTSVSVSNLQKWLREKRQMWPLHMVCHRARLVERFLEWSQAQGVISTNPFAESHRRYGPRTTPIVRALVSDDTEAALRELCAVPRFGSFLGKMMGEHVGLMRSLGYRYDVNERMLLRFDRFLQSRAELAGKALNQLIEAWAQSDPSPNRLWEAKRVGQLLSKAMHRVDPAATTFPMSMEMCEPVRRELRRPYVYSDEEIQRLLKAALAFPSPKAPLRPLSLYTMVVLAYCAGLRLGEIVRLTLADVNLQDGMIEIRETKFFKHRRLPLAAEVIAALKNYLAAREQAGAPTTADSGLFWNQKFGRRYSYGGLSILLVDVLRRAGVKPATGRIGPRIHDLRHTMVGHRMREWYREGINPQSKLPHLATYLGHKDIASTLVYLNITPELLHEASERFRKNGAATLQTTGESL